LFAVLFDASLDDIAWDREQPIDSRREVPELL
jgi:hypothetical protein